MALLRPKATAKVAKPSLFDLLDNLQTKNRAYYKALPADQQTAFHPLVVMKWLAAVSDEDQLLLLNELANSKVFALSHTDKDLVIDLLSVCTSGRKARFKWIKRPASTSNPIDDVFIQFYGAQVDLENARNTHTEEEIISLCHSLGMQDKEIKALLKR